MKFDSLLTFLMPKNDKFFVFFEDTANNLVESTELLKMLPTTPVSERAALIKRIEDKEHRGDSITHDIMSELNGTFITPFDREDIHRLASSLDDILDNIYGAVVRFQLYRVKDVPPDMVRLILEVLDRSVRQLHAGIHMVRHLEQHTQLYRDKAEVEEWRKRGPLTSLTTRLKSAGLMTGDDFQRLLRDADAEVRQAVQFAAEAPWEPVGDLERHVCAEREPA